MKTKLVYTHASFMSNPPEVFSMPNKSNVRSNQFVNVGKEKTCAFASLCTNHGVDPQKKEILLDIAILNMTHFKKLDSKLTKEKSYRVKMHNIQYTSGTPIKELVNRYIKMMRRFHDPIVSPLVNHWSVFNLWMQDECGPLSSINEMTGIRVMPQGSRKPSTADSNARGTLVNFKS